MIDDSLYKQPVKALSGMGRLSAADFGWDDEATTFAYVECDDGRGYHEIGYTEYLRFARDRGDLDSRAYCDAEGDLTAAGLQATEAALRTILAERSSLPAETLATVDVSDQDGGDEPSITATITVASTANMTVEAAVDTIFVPFWSAMVNTTDPGTFNYPYLWGHL